ncbi:MAG: HAD-IIIA family hydrolase [Alphaproteobacteria bacterium]|nr:HAD-IIIA family hydrolase [Alphaproteobacteria bacterium]
MDARPADFPFRTVVFDLDGTLIDSAEDVGAAVNRVLADHGLAPIDAATQRTLMGEGGRVRTRKAFALRGQELDDIALSARVRDFVRYYAENPIAHTTAYPGVPETLRRLDAAGVRLGVCTNKYEDSARDILARLGLMPPIADAAGADSFDVRKPHPGHILKLLARMGADPATALMVGDSIHDVAAARAAGLKVIAVSWGYTTVPARELGADTVIERFADLLEAATALA